MLHDPPDRKKQPGDMDSNDGTKARKQCADKMLTGVDHHVPQNVRAVAKLLLADVA